jgi:aspartate carbamoyltransferase catalytic subunit
MPATQNLSLLDTRSFSESDIHSLFSFSDVLRERGEKTGFFYQPQRPPAAGSKVVALLFFEPSTRTRLSFETAAYRLGVSATIMEPESSSLTKGETLSDTVLNVAAMKPDAIVVRWGSTEELNDVLPSLKIPVVNAGSGTLAHPTQALLDAYTIMRERGKVRGERVLIVGDIRHSRVAHSNFDVLTKLGAEVGVCGPDHFLPTSKMPYKLNMFRTLEEGVRWATVCMGLRIQLERHDSADIKDRLAEYHAKWGFTPKVLQSFSDTGILMHPGPINHGVEFDSRVLYDRRSRVLEQVQNGVVIRAAILSRILGLEV